MLVWVLNEATATAAFTKIDSSLEGYPIGHFDFQRQVLTIQLRWKVVSATRAEPA